MKISVKSKTQNRVISFRGQGPGVRGQEKVKWLFLFFILLYLSPVPCPLFPECIAQENTKLLTLSKQIIDAKYASEFSGLFEGLKDLYFAENKYGEFTDFLKSLSINKQEAQQFINYYIALSRYHQLKYLEDQQNWDEYFSQGNDYRKELQERADKAIELTRPADAVKIYAQLILWKFHKGQQDAFEEEGLSKLIDFTLEYAKANSDINPIKYIADEFRLAGEKIKAKEAYGIYINKLLASDVKQGDLLKIAADFYKDGNLELSEGVYDAYIEKVLLVYPKEKALPILVDIAKEFSYKPKGLSDIFYAEKIFDKISQLGLKEAFDENLLYLRAFNLETAKDYLKAKDIYAGLIFDYPKGAYADKVNFKLGIFSAYVSADLKNARANFMVLAQGQDLTPQSVSAFYHLGLLAQWESDFDSAKGYYNQLIKKAQDGFQDTVSLALARLKEIEEKKPIEYNLKIFLDLSLKQNGPGFDAAKLDLKASSYLAQKEQEINITVLPIGPQSGCMPVELRYLWSGNLGEFKPAPTETSFVSQYPYKGVKDINLVVVSPSGALDRNIEMIDID